MKTVTKDDLKLWVLEAVTALGGKAKLLDVAKYIWAHHEPDLRVSGDLFYKWQYDMRWAANVLRHEGKLVMPEDAPRGVWALK